MRIIITGGGTGGHIYPALAIAKGLQNKIREAEILYVGTKKGLEAEIVPKAGLPFQTISVEGLSRPFSYRTLASVFKACKGCWEGWHILRAFRPHVVIGTGGYVCGPLVFAAATLGIPTLLHEQNAVPGLTNRILARLVDGICVTFEDSLKYFPAKEKVHLTGLPVRQEIMGMERLTGIKALGLSANKTTIVVTGGSRGARSLNLAMSRAYGKLLQRDQVQFYHITGPGGYEEMLSFLAQENISLDGRENLRIVPYLYEMEYALAAADIIVGRAGASFLSEIMLRGLPSVLVPYPYAAANHQEYNARSLEKKGAAKMVLDQELEQGKLFTALEEIINNVSLRAEMAEAAKGMGKINALDEITQLIVGISKPEQR
ncbi:undecaprenyldiphospho-muramoylpentapeptide beta-N-acetylglucosaminyltransferase [Candidatus Formimonas warabiya]|uniref:UDP-N-acetylglucosamine--N-acetylmuramyl-(pentapeptide) pyrophosphoryl-undecaprenol N-acetylglucosamine transferase n=1 Tax=Formimonas warabiya TaxID=1761012 RepID=A0A3G1L1H1_FORW1|nr:undecaprenyldiphospho-muramoylpentapeptide beta-N-acetylglucosaminyltransferase [Candidatus Formimonas warabiya]ATW28507.1 undecaprenyldiphospho-muramoylpentapeptide beta-N-acetylglucosaminyltransferase [Candidatus Formimonas warabiya]